MTDPIDVKPIMRGIEDPHVLIRIGKITTRWSFIEAIVEDCIAELLGSKLPFTYVLTTNINISTRFKIVQGIGRMRLEDADFEELDRMMKRGIEIAPYRNKVIHALWSDTNEQGISFVEDYRSQGKLKYHAEFMTLDYLDWLSEQFRALAAELLHFGKKFGWFP